MANSKSGTAAAQKKNAGRQTAPVRRANSSKQTKTNKPGTKKENIFKRFITYLKNVRLEIKRTTWPTRSDVLHMSLIVMGALLFFFVMIFLIDQLMAYLINLYATVTAPIQSSSSSLLPAVLPTPGITDPTSLHAGGLSLNLTGKWL